LGKRKRMKNAKTEPEKEHGDDAVNVHRVQGSEKVGSNDGRDQTAKEDSREGVVNVGGGTSGKSDVPVAVTQGLQAAKVEGGKRDSRDKGSGSDSLVRVRADSIMVECMDDSWFMLRGEIGEDDAWKCPHCNRIILAKELLSK
jgi:hypothetical protein